MAIAILALGHGGGVPGPHGPVGNHGNTNFAIFPDFPDTSEPLQAQELLARHPYWLLDCGIETALRLSGAWPGTVPVSQNLQGILLTHGHDDHSGGIKSLGYRCRYIDGTKPRLVCPEDLQKMIFQQGVEFLYQNPGAKEHGITAHYRVTNWLPDWAHVFRVDHNCYRLDGQGQPRSMPAYGYRITGPQGDSMVFSGDTAYPLDLDVVKGAQWICHDVQWYNDGSQNTQVHCPYRMLRDAFPPEIRARTLLTHTGHDLPPEAEADGFRGLFRQDTLIVLR